MTGEPVPHYVRIRAMQVKPGMRIAYDNKYFPVRDARTVLGKHHIYIEVTDPGGIVYELPYFVWRMKCYKKSGRHGK